MSKAHTGKYKVNHPEMYKGKSDAVVYRSGWEMHCFKYLDGNPNVEWWNSEEFVVSYFYEVDKKKHRYYVDLTIKWKSGKTTLVEVKPKKQTTPPPKVNTRSKKYITEAMTYVKNINKWEAADRVAKDNGWEFRIWTEDELNAMKILPKSTRKTPGKLKKLVPLKPYRKKKKPT